MKKHIALAALVALSATLVGCGSETEIKISDAMLDGKTEVTNTVAYLSNDEASKLAKIYDEVKGSARLLENSPNVNNYVMPAFPKFSFDASEAKAAYDDYAATVSLLRNKTSMSSREKRRTMQAKHDAFANAVVITYADKTLKTILSSSEKVVTTTTDRFLKLEYKEGKPFAYVTTQKSKSDSKRAEIYNVKGIKEAIDVEEINKRLVRPDTGTVDKTIIANFSLFNKAYADSAFDTAHAMGSMIRRQDEYKDLPGFKK